MKFRTDGLIIKEMNIGEQDKLVYALTKSHGVIKAFARGAKSIKSAKRSAATLLTYSQLTFYKGRADAYQLGDAMPLKIFSRLRNDVKKTLLAQYFCELALTICPKEQNAETFLSLVLNSLYLIDEGKRKNELVKPCLEMRMTSMAGYMPDLRMCAVCGEYLADAMYFLPKSGTIECAACHTNRSGEAIEMSSSDITALRHTVYADDNKLFSFSLSDDGLARLNRASESYIKYRFEKDFKTLIYYNTL